MQIDLVPSTAWWSNVRSNVTRAEWEACKRYSKTKTDGCCFFCQGTGLEQNRKHATEAHEIFVYDDAQKVQTLVDILPLCPRCHQCMHLGRSREVMGPQQWAGLINHLATVGGFDNEEELYRYVMQVFETWRWRSQFEWSLDVSFLTTIGIDLSGRVLERQS